MTLNTIQYYSSIKIKRSKITSFSWNFYIDFKISISWEQYSFYKNSTKTDIFYTKYTSSNRIFFKKLKNLLISISEISILDLQLDKSYIPHCILLIYRIFWENIWIKYHRFMKSPTNLQQTLLSSFTLFYLLISLNAFRYPVYRVWCTVFFLATSCVSYVMHGVLSCHVLCIIRATHTLKHATMYASISGFHDAYCDVCSSRSANKGR